MLKASFCIVLILCSLGVCAQQRQGQNSEREELIEEGYYHSFSFDPQQDNFDQINLRADLDIEQQKEIRAEIKRLVELILKFKEETLLLKQRLSDEENFDMRMQYMKEIRAKEGNVNYLVRQVNSILKEYSS